MAAATATPFNQADLDACLKVLRAIVADRTSLISLTGDERRELMIAAGQVSRPAKADKRKEAKAFRKKEKKRRKSEDAQLREATTIRKKRSEAVFSTPPLLQGTGGEPQTTDHRLNEPRKCYVCKCEYTLLHSYYDQLCPACGDFNYQKRGQTASLHGRTALLTGGRIKIGYQATIMLLRAGARVIVTTRFPKDAARRYARENDFGDFRERLVIYGLDLRNTFAVEHFSEHLLRTEASLDFILHNACQTVKRPPSFYAHLMDGESERAILPEPAAALLPSTGYDARRATRDARASALLGPARERPCAHETESIEFPEGALDADLQQIDRRPVNSWRLTLAEVPTTELLEVHLVNAVAPFVLSARLKPLMLRRKTLDKHIVNVSAMEGQFYRSFKTDKHPHTNMAKAALNMLTRTSAADYVRDGIHMNSVDTGWITDEDPWIHAERKTKEHGFHPPLDIVDGAARICDPIFSGVTTGNHAYGQFFKDYFPTQW